MQKFERLAIALLVGLPSVVVVIGCWLTWLGGHQVVTGFETVNWTKATGTITKSETRRWTEGGRRMFSDEIVHHAADLEYEYTVAGKSFISKRIAIGESAPQSASDAAKRLKPYTVGGTVTVFYNPEDPTSACLVSGATSSAWVLLAAGLVLVVGGARFVLIWSRELKVFRNNEPQTHVSIESGRYVSSTRGS